MESYAVLYEYMKRAHSEIMVALVHIHSNRSEWVKLVR